PADLVRSGMLHLQVVFAHRPHARILALDTSAALQEPGVVAVLTARDVPYNAHGLIDADQPVLCGGVVRFEGDKVALVAAENKEAAVAGAGLVQIEYEDLLAVTDPRAAMAPGAPLVHEHHRSNVLLHMPIRTADAMLALAAWKLQRPVAIVWSREESMMAHHKRHPMTVHCRWGARKDGRITAVEAEVIADGGAYASTSVEVTKVATLFSSGCYNVPNI